MVIQVPDTYVNMILVSISSLMYKLLREQIADCYIANRGFPNLTSGAMNGPGRTNRTASAATKEQLPGSGGALYVHTGSRPE